MNTIPKIIVATGMALTLVIAGCGGGDDTPVAVAVPVTSVPDSAGASITSFITFLMSLDPNAETSEPLTIGDTLAVPPDEGNDPQPLA